MIQSWTVPPSSASFAVSIGLGFLLLGSAAGWLAGYEPSLDFVPLFLRALLITVVLLPFFQWFRLRAHTAGLRRSAATIAWFVVGLIAMVTAVSIGTWVSPTMLRSPPCELSFLAGALLLSQAIHRRKLGRRFAREDLA